MESIRFPERLFLIPHSMNDARDHEMLPALAVLDIVVVNGKAAHTKRKLVSKASSLGIVGKQRKHICNGINYSACDIDTRGRQGLGPPN